MLQTILPDTRAALKKLINADKPEEIAFVQNTAHALNLVAHSLPFKAGDNVVFTDMEYPANVYPWMNLERKGIESRIVPHRHGGLHLADLLEFVDERTRVVAASTVEFLTGFKNEIRDIGAFCRERGITFVVDGIQSLGAAPMDVQAYHIDVLAAGALKWLMGPAGIGFLYGRQELIEQMEPIFAGASSVVDSHNFLPYKLEFLPDATRFHVGAGNMVGMTGLLAAVNQLLDAGIENIERQTLYLTDLLISDLQSLRGVKILSDLTPHHRSAIVSFTTEQPTEAHKALLDAKVRCSLRADHHGTQYIRISPHGYNLEHEIHRVKEVLQTVLN